MALVEAGVHLRQRGACLGGAGRVDEQARGQTFALDETEELEDPRRGLWPDRAVEHRELLETVHALDSPFRETVVAVDVLGFSYMEAGTHSVHPSGPSCRDSRGRKRVIAALAPVQEVVACG